jgi:hypothetical protein
MKKETKIILGIGAIVLAYYVWNKSKTSNFSNARGRASLGISNTRLCCYWSGGRQRCSRVETVNGKCPQGYDQ